MAIIALQHVRLAPSESIALIFNDVKDTKVWRHRYKIRTRTGLVHEKEDYPFLDHNSIDEFEKFINTKEKPKGYFI